ncbi:MBL fold metallo-hydrolase [Melioribacteraceae bacterium 4301-Me]|uniref:MBL fold metallo-hydrolase n=1 Tax=Pyranulibacter aquaticus TaxID=3163344 RepID=UPI003596DF0D
METSRRKFVKKILLPAGGMLFFPPFLLKKMNAANEKAKLNYKPKPEMWDDNKITLAWLGHSTVLINFFGKWILTDPVLFERIGLYFLGISFGPTRLTPPALSINEIPKLDIILLSHAHMDHLDIPTLKEITNLYPYQIDIITAYLTQDLINDMKWKSITILDWNESSLISDVKFTAYEVKHFGWRFPWERDRSRGYFKDGRSYNSYLIEYKNKKIFFGGDTAFTDKLNHLNGASNIEIAIMPIGAYNPWKKNHCNPEEALQMAASMNAKYFVPVHTKTFKLGVEPFDEPIEWLLKSIVNYNIKLGLHEIGQTFVVV